MLAEDEQAAKEGSLTQLQHSTQRTVNVLPVSCAFPAALGDIWSSGERTGHTQHHMASEQTELRGRPGGAFMK